MRTLEAKIVTDCYIILPMTCPSRFLRYMASVALRTLRDSTDARVLVMLNNTPDEDMRKSVERECKLLHITYKYVNGPFSQSKFWNEGSIHADSKYVSFVHQDCIFYPGWLETIVEEMNRDESYFCMWPWSFRELPMGITYRQGVEYENRVIPHHDPSNVLVMRKSSGYKWDESFALWEMDADLILHCERNGIKMGLCLNSRVDHFGASVISNIDFSRNFGVGYNEHVADCAAKMNLKREQCKTP